MGVTLRLLTDDDKDLDTQAYRWRNDHPRWFQECLDIWKESEEEYLLSAPNELRYGVWHNEEFVAVIRFIPIPERDWVFNLHLSAKKGIDFDALHIACATMRDFLFSQGKIFVYGYLPAFNRGISKLYENTGFVDTGIRIFKGIVREKLVEWKHYVITNSESFSL